MDSFEKKLEEYRAHQKRKKFVDKVKTTFKSIMNYGIYEKEKENTDVKIPIPVSKILRFQQNFINFKLPGTI